MNLAFGLFLRNYRVICVLFSKYLTLLLHDL